MRSDQLLINEQIKDAVNAVLGKIRDEIATAYNECSIEDYDYASGLKHAMNVIDKHR